MKEHLLQLDNLNVNLTQGSMLLVNCILAFVMFGVALGIKLDTFKDIVRNPKSVLTSSYLLVGYHPQSYHHPYGGYRYDSRGLLPRW